MKPPNRGKIAARSFKPAPADIDTEAGHFWNAFGHHETEVSAKWLCRLAQIKGGWLPFTRDEIEKLYLYSFTFNRLIEPGTGYGRPGEKYLTGGGWIVEMDGLLHFTEEFVTRCFLSSNNKSEELRERYPEEKEPREYR